MEKKKTEKKKDAKHNLTDLMSAKLDSIDMLTMIFDIPDLLLLSQALVGMEIASVKGMSQLQEDVNPKIIAETMKRIRDMKIRLNEALLRAGFSM